MRDATNDASCGKGTLLALVRRKLDALCDAIGSGKQKHLIVGMFDGVAALCPDRGLTLPPRWSGVLDDCTPVEFSVAFNRGTANVRILLEAQDDPPSAQSYWTAAKRLTEWLRRNHPIGLEKFESIEDLFVPTDPCAIWAMWHGADFDRERPPLFKIYLNPMAQGFARADDIVREALSRLGRAEAWTALEAVRGPSDIFSQLSLDLSSAPQARVKAYVRCRNPSLAELDARQLRATDDDCRDWSSFCKLVAEDDPLWRRPLYACYHVADETPLLKNAVIYVPTYPYCQTDAVASRRIEKTLCHFGIPTDGYKRCVEALADGPLDQQQGLHSFVSFQRQVNEPRITVYFGPRAYYPRYGAIALDPDRFWPSPVA